MTKKHEYELLLQKNEALKDAIHALDNKNGELLKENEALRTSNRHVTAKLEADLKEYRKLGTPDETRLLISKVESLISTSGSISEIQEKLESYDSLQKQTVINELSDEFGVPTYVVESFLDKTNSEEDARDLLRNTRSESVPHYDEPSSISTKVKYESAPDYSFPTIMDSGKGNNINVIKNLMKTL